MSLLLVVVVLTVATNLLSTIGAPAINAVLWKLYTALHRTSPVAAAIPKAAAVRQEVLKLKTELAATSSQDEFARWAKVRRTHDKKVVELESINASIATYRATFDSRARSARWLLTTGLRLFLQFWYSKSPMFWLPQGWVPGVVERGLSFPRAPRGSVSIQVWSFAVGQVVTVIMLVLVWAWAQVVALRRKKAVPAMGVGMQAEKKKA
ncbi:CHD5-like protein-domain-containing protein [Tricharina praecox]|uniref:CHD5-like protein-domain-containing protein n=1 Tax=Tricharina praecox TaxID=43433 RepID=UPI00221F36D0|nr:CHD5-like protein-domain-containing protein [Tricharina praecox]KAI5845418.1 CHD5-like protein-domain-containing protein [Tricharina praecox]